VVAGTGQVRIGRLKQGWETRLAADRDGAGPVLIDRCRDAVDVVMVSPHGGPLLRRTQVRAEEAT
jgi:hypothetical protein